jgi:large subunit ribosomal protein L19
MIMTIATVLEQFNERQINKLVEDKAIPDFKPGDLVKVDVIITEGAGEKRVQAFEGVCIKRKNRGLHSSFTIRRNSANSEYVERNFKIYSPRIDKITLVRKGDVRRAKLYYLRGRTGKAARIKELVVDKKDK